MNIKLYELPKKIRLSFAFFLLALSFGYFSGLDMLKQTTKYTPSGIEQNVLGNEFDESVEKLHFKMSERELHAIIHTHVISISLILVVLTSLLYFSSFTLFKSFLMIEPYIFNYNFWRTLAFMARCFVDEYVIMISGFLMHLSIIIIVFILLKNYY